MEQGTTEVEYRLLTLPDAPLRFLSETLEQAKRVNHLQSINCIDSTAGIIKQVDFEGMTKRGVSIYQKVPFQEPEFFGTNYPRFKLSVCAEVPMPQQTHVDLVRIKNRLRMSVDALPRWFVDFTVVRQLRGSPNISVIQQVKQWMFGQHHGTDDVADRAAALKDFSEQVASENSADTKVEIEFELKPGERFDRGDLAMLVRFVAQDSQRRSQDLRHVAALLGRSTTTLKQLLPHAIEVNKAIYREEVFPRLSKFWISDKADGVRVLVRRAAADGPVVWFTSTESGELAKGVAAMETFIAEAELVGDRAYLYDLLELNGRSLVARPFEERYAALQTLHLEESYAVKRMLPVAGDLRTLFHQAIHRPADSPFTAPYTSDGIILTLSGKPYMDTKVYKWKPVAHMSIDFVARSVPLEMLGFYRPLLPAAPSSDHRLYVLFCGIRRQDFDRLGMRQLPYYRQLFGDLFELDYIPVHFTPADDAMAFVFWHDQDIDNQVVELTRTANEEPLEKQWRLLRVRTDRAADVASGAYFGNSYFVAEIIWRNFANPVTEEGLTDGSVLVEKAYFRQSNATNWEALRRYHNWTKGVILDKFRGVSIVVDLAGGKGQDLHKYTHNKVGKVILVESNQDNICEALARRRVIVQRGKRMPLHAVFQDLNAPFEEVLRNLRRTANFRGKVPLVVCQFAVHYFMTSKAAADNFAELVGDLVQPNGHLILTFMDGNRVNESFQGAEELVIGTQYRIRRMYRQKTVGLGQRVLVSLPFTEVPYEECLVNINKTATLLAKRKLFLEYHMNLDEFIAKYPDRAELSDEDRAYSALHLVAVFRKTA